MILRGSYAAGVQHGTRTWQFAHHAALVARKVVEVVATPRVVLVKKYGNFPRIVRVKARPSDPLDALARVPRSLAYGRQRGGASFAVHLRACCIERSEKEVARTARRECVERAPDRTGIHACAVRDVYHARLAQRAEGLVRGLYRHARALLQSGARKVRRQPQVRPVRLIHEQGHAVERTYGGDGCDVGAHTVVRRRDDEHRADLRWVCFERRCDVLRARSEADVAAVRVARLEVDGAGARENEAVRW